MFINDQGIVIWLNQIIICHTHTQKKNWAFFQFRHINRNKVILKNVDYTSTSVKVP